MADDLSPSFRYHPDPVATGSVVASTRACRVCGAARGSIYVGPVYAVEELGDEICPWCIADGSAADRFDATFTDVGWGVPPGVPAAVTEELASRTPGFVAWQEVRWLYHCDDGVAFLGRVGYEEVRAWGDARAMLLHEHDELGWSAEEAAAHVESLHADGEVTAYLFRCLHCGRHLASSDMS